MNNKRPKKPLNRRKIWECYPKQWVAFSSDKTRVITHGRKLSQVVKVTNQKGIANAVFSYVPPKEVF